MNQFSNNLNQISRNKWLRLGYCSILFCFVSLAYTFNKENEYKSRTSFYFVDGSNSDLSGGLSSLKMLSGLGMSSQKSSYVISPMLYSDVIYSDEFINELLDINIESAGAQSSFLDYIFFRYKLPSDSEDLFQEYKSHRRNSQVLIINDTFEDLSSFLRDRINVFINDDNGLISIEFTGVNSFVTAEVTNKIRDLLESRVSQYNLESINQDLQNLNKSKYKLDKNLLSYRDSLASFRNSNYDLKDNNIILRSRYMEQKYQYLLDALNVINQNIINSKVKLDEGEIKFGIISKALPNETPININPFFQSLFYTIVFAVLGFNILLITQYFKN